MKLLLLLLASIPFPQEELTKEDFTRYRYKAEVISVYDGDTMTVNVNLGLGINSVQKLRLYGIDTPEVRGAERTQGLISRNRLRQLCPNGSYVYLKTQKDKTGKYGRLLSTIFINRGSNLINVNKLLIEEGLAREEYYD